MGHIPRRLRRGSSLKTFQLLLCIPPSKCGFVVGKLAIFPQFLTSQRRPFQFDSVGVVCQSIKDTVGNGRFCNDVMPLCYRQLRSENNCLGFISIFEYLQQSQSCRLVGRLEAEIVNDQEACFFHFVEPFEVRPIELDPSELFRQTVHTEVEGAVAKRTGLPAEC